MCAVEWKSLEELGNFYGGLSGKSKDDFQDGNAKFVTYMNVYSNMSLDLTIVDMVKVGEDEKQNSIKYGDILFTGSSETPDDCGMSCVVTRHVDEPIYLNSFCFGFRFDDFEKFEPDFLKHYFRCIAMRKAISLTASGVTRFNVSKKRFGKIQIPLLHVSKQQEIVSHLDTFTTLISNLESELDMRRKQYEHYRNQLLDFEGVEGVEWKTLGEIIAVLRGRRLTKNELLEEGKFPVYHGGLEPLGYYDKNNREGDAVMIINVGASAGTVGYCNCDFWSSDGCFCLSKSSTLQPKYLYNLLKIREHLISSKVRKAGIPTLDSKVIEDLVIPIVGIETQQEIVEKLDAFENLIQSLEQEIKLRKQQYEYYREKLLTFEKE